MGLIDPYLELEIAEDADDAAVEAAYRKLLQAYPPERDGERFARIRVAYERIRTAEARAEYRFCGLRQPCALNELFPPTGFGTSRPGVAAWLRLVASSRRPLEDES